MTYDTKARGISSLIKRIANLTLSISGFTLFTCYFSSYLMYTYVD